MKRIGRCADHPGIGFHSDCEECYSGAPAVWLVRDQHGVIVGAYEHEDTADMLICRKGWTKTRMVAAAPEGK